MVKPAARATEAITRLVAPESEATKGYEAMADTGESQKLLGIDVEQQKTGVEGAEQIASDVLKVGSYLFPYGKVAGVAGKALGGSKMAKIAGNVASGVTGGYMFDVSDNLLKEDATIGDILKPGLGTVLGGAIPAVAPVLGGVSKQAKNLLKSNKTNTDVVKRITTGGEIADIPLAEKAFNSIDTTGVTTRQELSTRLKKGLDKQIAEVDDWLSKDPRELSLDDYAIRETNNAGQEVKTDMISEAFNNLDEIYAMTGDSLSRSNLNLIKQKALTQGLTHQEVNNIARMYSEEFGAKAFNKVGDPLTSVTAQKFENVRKALKKASRGGLGYGKEAQQADFLYHAIENTKRIIDKGAEGVNKLEARLKDYNVLQKLSRNAVKFLNTITGGGLKAGIEALGVSNVGNKIDNWVDLEKSLKSDLEFLKKANTVKSDSAFIKFINDYANKFKFPGDKLIDDLTQSKALPTNRSTIKTTKIVPNTSISKTIPQPSLKVKGETPTTRKIIPDLNLKGEDAKIQDASIAKYKSNPEKLRDEYIKANGKVANTDEARKLFKDVGYKGSNSASVQEASSAVAKDVWEHLLNTTKEKLSLIFAGGSGTGKTSAVKNFFQREIADAGAILDGNLSTMKSADARIAESIKAGKYPNIVYVYRDPVDAWINGVIKRMKGNAEEGGRVVPLSEFIKNHKGSYDVVKTLLNDSANGIKYDVKMVDNSLGKGRQALLERSKFDTIKYSDKLESELLNQTKKLYEKGTITKEQYQALIK